LGKHGLTRHLLDFLFLPPKRREATSFHVLSVAVSSTKNGVWNHSLLEVKEK